MKILGFSPLLAGCAFALTLAATPGCRRDTTIVADYVASLPGYELRGLDEGQRQEFLRIVNSEICPCGPPAHLGACVAAGRQCPDAQRMVRYTIRRLQAGDATSRIIHMLDRMFQQGDKAAELPADDAPARGAPGAPITLTMFSDFECPFCKKAEPVMERILKEFAGKVRVVFRHLPLPNVHKHAASAALAAVAAHNQGKFWELHALLFKNNLNLEKENLGEYARRAGLDLERWQRDLQDPKTKQRVEADIALAQKLGVSGTPAFFINGKAVAGGGRFENYRDYIEVALEDTPKTPAPSGGATAAGK